MADLPTVAQLKAMLFYPATASASLRGTRKQVRGLARTLRAGDSNGGGKYKADIATKAMFDGLSEDEALEKYWLLYERLEEAIGDDRMADDDLNEYRRWYEELKRTPPKPAKIQPNMNAAALMDDDGGLGLAIQQLSTEGTPAAWADNPPIDPTVKPKKPKTAYQVYTADMRPKLKNLPSYGYPRLTPKEITVKLREGWERIKKSHFGLHERFERRATMNRSVFSDHQRKYRKHIATQQQKPATTKPKAPKPRKAKPKKAPSKAKPRARPNLKVDTSGGYSRYHGQRRDGKIATKTAPKAGSYEDYDDSDELAAMMGKLSLPKPKAPKPKPEPAKKPAAPKRRRMASATPAAKNKALMAQCKKELTKCKAVTRRLEKLLQRSSGI